MALTHIDPDVRGICETFASSESFTALVQAIVTAEGDIVAAVRKSIPSVATREEAIRVVCRSVVHRMADFVYQNGKTTFIDYMRDKWAPLGAANDPHGLNAHWAPNVSSLWKL